MFATCLRRLFKTFVTRDQSSTWFGIRPWPLRTASLMPLDILDNNGVLGKESAIMAGMGFVVSEFSAAICYRLSR